VLTCVCLCVCVLVCFSLCVVILVFYDCRIYLFSSLAARVFNKLTRYSLRRRCALWIIVTRSGRESKLRNCTSPVSETVRNVAVMTTIECPPQLSDPAGSSGHSDISWTADLWQRYLWQLSALKRLPSFFYLTVVQHSSFQFRCKRKQSQRSFELVCPKETPYIKERKRKEEYLCSAFLHQGTHKVLRHGSHSFTCKQHHACLSFVHVHQMSLPQQLRQQTSSCSTLLIYRPRKEGWKAELA